MSGDQPYLRRGAAALGIEGDGQRPAIRLDPFEHDALCIARHFFEAFAHPEGHAWVQALREAERAFPVPFGASIAHAILIAINEVRASKRQTFWFERPGRPSTDSKLTEDERYLILILQAIRRGDSVAARAHALFLCEGGQTAGVLAAFERLAIITGDVSDLRYN